jgi:nucleotide-binding universal stress UspA family protein
LRSRRIEMNRMNGLIVVGIDGSDQSKQALRWALEEARLRGASVRVVYAWWARPVLIPGSPVLAGDWELQRRSAEEFVEDFVEQEVDKSADAEVTPVAVHGIPADVLVQRGKGADLLVVGSRGHGGIAGLLLGSVSQHCVHHATCPVVIVRGSTVEQGETAERETGVALPA